MSTDIQSVDQFQKTVLANERVVVFFCAVWSEPCKALDAIVAEMQAGHGALCWLKVDAEGVPEISAHLSVTAVPTFVFLHKGDVVDRLEGFDPAALYDKVARHAERKAQPLDDRLRALVTSKPVMLFMKGTPDAPRCGFSSKVVAALRQAGVPFGTFDILTDEEVRQGLKKFSDWPTYPQLFAGGELLGGCDIVLEMQQAGELRTAIEDAVTGAGMELPQSEDVLNTRIAKLISSHPVMLFMKGSPEQPRCGFSRRVVEALNAINVSFGHFDILTDETIRQGVKKYSDWPTFPQLFAGGELQGGCDIVEELAKTGELASTLQSAVDAAKTGHT